MLKLDCPNCGKPLTIWLCHIKPGFQGMHYCAPGFTEALARCLPCRFSARVVTALGYDGIKGRTTLAFLLEDAKHIY